MNFRCASPAEYDMNSVVTKHAMKLAKQTEVREFRDPEDAVRGADVVVTDTWVSMGDEAQKSARIKDLRRYQVNTALMKLAKKDAIFLHCLPAYRDNEVTSDVIDGPQSVVWDEAENRLHVQKALMLWLTGLAK
jgi:ornithine carbamoyltransferase